VRSLVGRLGQAPECKRGRLVRGGFALVVSHSPYWQAEKSLERVGGQDGDEEHDLRFESIGNGSTHHPPVACRPTSPANRKTRVLTDSYSEPNIHACVSVMKTLRRTVPNG